MTEEEEAPAEEGQTKASDTRQEKPPKQMDPGEDDPKIEREDLVEFKG
jgi:hypothetical protein